LRDSAEQATFGAAVGGAEVGNGAMTFVIPSPGSRFTGKWTLSVLGKILGNCGEGGLDESTCLNQGLGGGQVAPQRRMPGGSR
jgi:hypothetical protein